MKTLQFKKWRCKVLRGVYENGNVALQLVEVNTGKPVAVATVNNGMIISEPYAVIKDYSENAGMYDALITAGMIKFRVGWVPVGFAQCPLVCLDLQGVEYL